MENTNARILALENLVEDFILKLGRANHRIAKLTQRIDSLEQDQLQIPQSNSSFNQKVVSL